MTPPAATPTLQPHAARKPTQLMTDLAAAIRATTESARDQALAAVDADATQVTEDIRAAAAEGAQGIRLQSETDLASIKEWSKAEIARIREETDARIAARKSSLESELASHAAAVECRVGEVDRAVVQYRADMEAYVEGLAGVDDPARLATMAEAMPEPPALDALANLDTMDVSAFAPVEIVEAEPEAVAEAEAPAVAEAVAEAEAQAVAEAEAQAVAEAVSEDEAGSAWGRPDQTWTTGADENPAGADDTSGWATADVPESDPGDADSGDPVDPVDPDTVMAATATIPDVNEAVEERLIGTEDAETESEAVAAEAVDAEAAMSARLDALDPETQSFTDRLASLMPGHGDDAIGGDPRTTQVVVTGLVSVASIASFKRHLGRLAGVQGVAVSSGPEGEFVFNVTHLPDVSFRDAIPSMPGFAARVTSATDSLVSVTARDPETEG